jgi:hypothetical protein
MHPIAPSIVAEVLRSPGHPLEPATRDFMEKRFDYDFGRIRIHADQLAARASTALGADAFTVGHHIAFARGRFVPDSQHGKRLVAHELWHTMHQAATSPHIALRPDKEHHGDSRIVGAILGQSASHEQVRVTREVGGNQGYDDRLQAIAVARIAKAEPAAAVQDKNGKWHAVEITASFEAGTPIAATASEGATFLAVYGLPSLAGVEQSRVKVDALRKQLADLSARKPTSEDDRRAIEKEEDQARTDLAKASLNHEGLVLGVPESEINQTASLSGRVAGKINIVGSPAMGSPGAGHAPLGGGNEFQKGLASAVWIDLPELDKPRAAESMFHEVSHLKDWDLAQQWIKAYETETKRVFVKEALAPLGDWLTAQVKKGRLTHADQETVMMEAGDATAYTEARANVRSFLADLQAGAPDLATKAFVGYAHALKPRSQGGGGEYANPANGSAVVAALVAELKDAYRQMPESIQRQYDAAVAAARKENPGAWISDLDFAKRAGK